MSDKATLTLGDAQYEPASHHRQRGRARDRHPRFACPDWAHHLDPGFGNTGSCESAITFIDGEQGILRYRGIPIESFAASPNFGEVAWLLICGSCRHRTSTMPSPRT